VIALRPDPPQHVKFSASPAGKSAAVSAVATGYATGSMSGSPHGWSHPTVDPSNVALPRAVAQLDSSWTPDGVYADASSQGTGTPAAPLLVLADQTAGVPRFLVVSVQTPVTLGPGHGGEPFSSNGLSGRIISDNGSGVQVIADVPGGHRVEATAVGIDRATVLQLIATLHQDQGGWVMDGSGGLSAVATTPPASSTTRTLNWTKADPATSADPGGRLSQNVTVTVTTGGAYEFYGEAVEAGMGPFDGSASATTVLGHHVVASAVSTMPGSVNTLLLDDQGLVFNLMQIDNSPGASAPAAPLTLAVATDAEWTTLINAAATAQAAEQAAIAAKRAAVTASGAKSGGTDPASGYKSVSDGSVAATYPPTTAPPVGLVTTTTVSATP